MALIRKLFILGNVFWLTGCAGPKFMSNSDGRHTALRPIPQRQSVVILPFNDSGIAEKIDNQSAGDYFAGRLLEKFLTSGLFAHVTVGSSPQVTAALVVSGSISSLGQRSWGNRALRGNAKTSLEVTGQIRDHDDNLLLTFTKSREAQGGLVGAGGWFTAGAGQMVKQLVDWVASDVVNAVKKETNKKNAK